MSWDQSPNRGVSAPDTVASGNEHESLKAWREKNAIDRSKQVRLVKLAHMRYQHPDLAEITTFLRGKLADDTQSVVVISNFVRLRYASRKKDGQ